jgi:hypothetical protein
MARRPALLIVNVRPPLDAKPHLGRTLAVLAAVAVLVAVLAMVR